MLYTPLYNRLNTWLRDTDDFTFSQAEKQEALNAAIDDPFVYTYERDASTVIAANTPSYPLPTGWEELSGIAVDRFGDGSELNIDRSAWNVIGGRVYLRRDYMLGLPVGKALILYGKHKLAYTDDYPVFLQEYILCRAAANTLNLLRAGHTNRFLKNDVTLGELIQSGNSYLSRAEQLKRNLHNHASVRV